MQKYTFQRWKGLYEYYYFMSINYSVWASMNSNRCISTATAEIYAFIMDITDGARKYFYNTSPRTVLILD